MDVTIVILCWRNQEHLPALLRSIAGQRTSSRFDVVICHNEAESAARSVRPDAPAGLAISEVFSGANLGYGGGNNFAIAWVRQRSDPRYFLILNSDVVLHDGALDALVKWADGHPEMAVVGAVHDDPSRPGYRCFGGSRYDRTFSIITPNASPAGRGIDYVHGAAALLRSADFPAGKPFADKYFLFFEELELAARVEGMGKRIGYCPECRVSHFEGASRRRRRDDFPPEVAEYFENLNALRFTRDHHPRSLPTVLLFRVPGKFAYLCLRAQGARLVFWALAITDFLRGRVRRFPFQSGWQPGAGRDQVVDSDFPWLLRRLLRAE
jgi:GT2 family glycosyltransferase